MKKTHSSQNKYPREHGQVVMMAVFIFLTLSLVVIIGIAVPISAQIRNSNSVIQTKKSLIAADSLSEEALYRLNTGRALPATLVLSLNSATSTAVISDVGGAKQIISSGVSGSFQRNAKALFISGGGISFNYGLQVGNGGLIMSGGPTVYGPVYANGDIIGNGGSTITDSAISASSFVVDADTQNDDGETSPASFQTVGTGAGVQTIAQSFTVSTTTPVTSIDFLVKKTGAPANATMRVYNDDDGNVDNTQIGESGSLSASLINTSSYTWVKVYPYAPIALTPGTTYWITFQYSGNASNYYTFATNNIFTEGAMKLKNSSGGYYNPSPSNLDMYFRVFTGGVSTISGMTIEGYANAGIVNDSTVNGDLYCQVGSSNNKVCNTSQPIPVSIPSPLTTATIDGWKAAASSGTIRNSSWNLSGDTATSTPGPMKIIGDLSVSSGATLTVNGPLYVTGTISVGGNSKIQLGPGYGAGDEKIIAQYVRLTGGGQVLGNGISGNYVVLVVDGFDCPSGCNGSDYVISTSGGTASIALIAPNGSVHFTGGTTAKSIIAKTIIMDGGSTLRYESGLSNMTFTNASSTSWNVASWKEIE